MIGFELLLGHLVGDYLVQNDWMANTKTATDPGPRPPEPEPSLWTTISVFQEIHAWEEKASLYRNAGIACTLHCLCYTLAVWAFTFLWMPWWGLLLCFAVHWPLDRRRLAVWWMKNVAGQQKFASKEHPLFPWSVIVVDNTFHLLTLYLIAKLAGVG